MGLKDIRAIIQSVGNNINSPNVNIPSVDNSPFKNLGGKMDVLNLTNVVANNADIRKAELAALNNISVVADAALAQAKPRSPKNVLELEGDNITQGKSKTLGTEGNENENEIKTNSSNIELEGIAKDEMKAIESAEDVLVEAATTRVAAKMKIKENDIDSKVLPSQTTLKSHKSSTPGIGEVYHKYGSIANDNASSDNIV